MVSNVEYLPMIWGAEVTSLMYMDSNPEVRDVAKKVSPGVVVISETMG